MLKILFAMFLGALVVFAFGLVLWSSLDFQECIKSYGQYNPSTEHLEKGVSPFVISIPTYRHCVGAYVTDKNAVITALGTLVIALFTTVLGIFTISLAGSTRIAANAAKESADAVTQSERAHIFIKIVSQSFVEGWTSANLERVTTDDQVSAPVTVQFAFKNYGKTPAILSEVSRDIIIAPDFPDEVDYIPVEFVPTERVIASDEATDTWECMITHISKRDLNAMIRAQTSYWFFGRVLYNDIFGNGHEHRFIYRYNSSRGWNTFHHPEYSKNT
jgi:hypothetical protein